ncbi:hypothetical protein BDL97_08G099200 [Sphagnum fallax]|nr:hypothetical protein BDL97_08G099200 [Sphagnum fallax]
MEHGEIALVADDAGNHVSATTAGGGRGADGGGGDGRVKKESWTALLQSKCEVLGMEKELAMQRWRQQCMEMAKATEMVQTLRGSVETILEATMRGAASAPCTPNRKKEEDGGVDRFHKFQQLKMFREPQQQHKGKTKGDRMLLQETQVDDRQQKETIDKIVTQVKADAEEWAQIQGVLKHIKDEMKTLQQNCDNWEQRALHAESKSAILQIEGPFLQAGGKHAYVLVLKPVLRESTSDICTCNISGDFEECQECAKWCQMPLTQNRSTGKFLCNACASNAFKFDDTEQCMGCGSLQRVADSQMVATPRVQSPLQKSTMEVSRVNDRRGAGCSPRSQSNLSPDGPPKAKDERILSGTSEMTISEVERSLKQKWFKQRKPNRRSNSAYSSDTSLQENNANVHVQPNSTRGRTDGRYSVKMSRPPSASNLKVSPPHLFQEQLPLSEMRRNTVHER